MGFENESILAEFVKRQQPMQYKVDSQSGRAIFRCHNDFGALDGRDIKNMIPNIVDFGLAQRLDRSIIRNGIEGQQLGVYPIQPDYYRAPEVILGCGWDFKADIWNLGVLVSFTATDSKRLMCNAISFVVSLGLGGFLLHANITVPQAVEHPWEQGIIPAGA